MTIEAKTQGHGESAHALISVDGEWVATVKAEYAEAVRAAIEARCAKGAKEISTKTEE
jgi:hypothetical protein